MQKQKNGMVDIYKFILAVTIAYGHAHIVGVETPIHHLTNLVEGFLLITGYYTNEHFKNTPNIEVADIFVYTYHKFKRFFIYVFISVFVAYMIVMFGKPIVYGESLFVAAKKWLDFPFDALLLNSISSEIGYFLPQLWTLSNMLIVFPAVCFFCCMSNKNVKTLIALYFPLLFYASLEPAFGTTEFPTYILRAIAGLLIGVFINELQPILNKMMENRRGGYCISPKLMFLFANLMMLGALALTYCGSERMRLITWLEILGLALILDKNITYSLTGNYFTDILGKSSMILYIWHMTPIIIASYLLMGWDSKIRAILVLSTEAIGTVLLLMLSLLCDKLKVKKIKNR